MSHGNGLSRLCAVLQDRDYWKTHKNELKQRGKKYRKKNKRNLQKSRKRHKGSLDMFSREKVAKELSSISRILVESRTSKKSHFFDIVALGREV